MAGKLTDRKSRKSTVISDPHPDTVAAFVLPESLPCSEIEFPVLERKSVKVSWNKILEESNDKFREIADYTDIKQQKGPKPPFQKTECDFISSEIFVHLLPALEETLNKAKLWDVLVSQKSFFNGIDHIAQILWNSNPRYPLRNYQAVHLFNMPWVREHLTQNPRPFYPKSWLWPEEYAATIIQKTVRQYFVQREDDVQEMREFWKKLEIERKDPDIVANPLLAKKFASEHTKM